MSDKVVITGAAGLIGGHLMRAFATRGSVLGIDVREFDVDLGDVVPMQADIADPLPAVDGFENATIIHAAAVMKARDDDTSWNVNVNGTRHVLDWAAKREARHFIFFSTGGVYGYGRGKRWKETDTVNPIGVYCYTKWIGESLARMYASLYGIPFTVIRLFWPYGPGQTAGVFAFIRRAVAEGIELRIKENGSPRMNPVHVDDVVAAVEAMVAAGGQNRIYNVCGDETVSFLEAVRLFEERLSEKAVCTFTGEDEGDLLGDNARLKQELGWRPAHALSGLTEAILR